MNCKWIVWAQTFQYALNQIYMRCCEFIHSQSNGKLQRNNYKLITADERTHTQPHGIVYLCAQAETYTNTNTHTMSNGAYEKIEWEWTSTHIDVHCVASSSILLKGSAMMSTIELRIHTDKDYSLYIHRHSLHRCCCCIRYHLCHLHSRCRRIKSH